MKLTTPNIWDAASTINVEDGFDRMKNCLVLGSGRSGTSMLARTLASAGFFMGEEMMPPTPGNPKGYFESFDVEAINEELIAPLIPARPQGFFGRFFKTRPVRAQRWLARVSVEREIPCPEILVNRIKKLVSKEPYCFKDPRFCYTLPAWRPYLKNIVFICVFRHPADTAFSILQECKNEKYLQDLTMNFAKAVKVWNLMYNHILVTHMHIGEWLFLHYNQVLTPEGINRIERFIDGVVDKRFPDQSLQRSKGERNVGKKANVTYEKLCQLAGYP